MSEFKQAVRIVTEVLLLTGDDGCRTLQRLSSQEPIMDKPVILNSGGLTGTNGLAQKFTRSLMAIGLLGLAMVRAADAAQPALADAPTSGSGASSTGTSSTPTQLVDALNLVFGKQTDNRAVHAKGIVLHGQFVPSSAAAGLSRAPHFQKNAVPLTIRFSDFAGIPNIPDNDGLANPRGLALKFKLPDGTNTDLVTHSFNGFPSPTADDFRQFLIALGTSGPGVAHPTPADTYLAAHPVAKTFLETQKQPPVSYATLSYYGVNTFKFTNAQGVSRYGRYRIIPEAGEQFLTAEQAKQASSGYLADEIRQRTAKAPLRFRMLVQLAANTDKIEDPSIAWPETRATIDLGTIEITSVAADSNAEQRSLMFLPTALPAGIEAADPMIAARSAAYPVSYGRRHQ
jgi:catalase